MTHIEDQEIWFVSEGLLDNLGKLASMIYFCNLLIHLLALHYCKLPKYITGVLETRASGTANLL